MKMSDNYILALLNEIGPKSSTELFHLLKKNRPQLTKQHIIRRLQRLRKKSHIQITKQGKFIPQIALEKKKSSFDLSENDFLNICEKYKYKISFTKSQLNEADNVKKISSLSYKNRKDFRKHLIITIDDIDAKDLDDGVSIDQSVDGYTLSVHIADVSYYVKERSQLDREAYKRGNSVYLIDKVIPMLPEALSNGVCSLNQKEDRFTLSVVISFNMLGEIQKYDFYEGIINVARRFSYNEVEEILQKGKAIIDEHKPFVKQLKIMKELADILYKKRIREGSLDFNFDETKIILDDKSFPIAVQKRERLSSHKLIEEFMLSANKVAARFLGEKGLSIYRIHETPDPEKLKDFNRFIRKFGYNLKDISDPDPSQFQELLTKISNKKEEKLINTILLRTMKQAYYHIENKGHFGLSFKNYTHFTSPIRRYSDLLIHRLLKDALSVDTENKLIKDENHLLITTKHISTTERTAMDAEREIIKIKSARFMKTRVGEVFDGTISGVTSFGLFVEMHPFGIEGLVRVSDLKGYFIYDEENYSLVRKDKKITYQMGSGVRVILAKVDVKRNFIDLILTDT